MKVEPVTLEGLHVRLEPLREAHHAALCEVGLDRDLWKYIPYTAHTPEEMRAYIVNALHDETAGTALPFTTVERASGRVVGATRFMNIDSKNRRVEIGATWLGKSWQHSAINTEAKYLLLRHAFETLGCIRVEFKTDALNQQSRSAIVRIGARQEGIFRQHMIMPGGRLRDSVYFSIVDGEWPAVKTGLEKKLTRA